MYITDVVRPNGLVRKFSYAHIQGPTYSMRIHIDRQRIHTKYTLHIDRHRIHTKYTHRQTDRGYTQSIHYT